MNSIEIWLASYWKWRSDFYEKNASSLQKKRFSEDPLEEEKWNRKEEGGKNKIDKKIEKKWKENRKRKGKRKGKGREKKRKEENKN